MKLRSNFARSKFVFREEIGKGKSKVNKVGKVDRKEEGRREGKKNKRKGKRERGMRETRNWKGKEDRVNIEIMTGNVNGKAKNGRT